MLVIIFQVEVFLHGPADELVEEHEPAAVGVDLLEGGCGVSDAYTPARERRERMREFGEGQPAVACFVQPHEHLPLLELLAQLAQEHSEFCELDVVRADLAEALRGVLRRVEGSDYGRLRIEQRVDRKHVSDSFVDFSQRKLPVAICVELTEHSFAAFLVLRRPVQWQLGMDLIPID